MEKYWRKTSGLPLASTLKCQTTNGATLSALAEAVGSEDLLSPSRRILKQMNSKGKKFQITIETHEIFIVRLRRDTEIHGFCAHCNEEPEMLTLDSTGRVLGVREREVIRQVATDEIHSIETTSGNLLVCRNCLKNCLRKESSGGSQL